jgi:UDP-N-acetylglucosamine acyltransferase
MIAHPTAVIDPQAQVASSVKVGPYTVIEAGVEIGEDTEVMSHVVIQGPTRIGRRNRIFPYAAVGFPCQDLKYHGEPTRLEIGDDNVLREFITLHRGTVDGGGLTRLGNHNFLMAYVHIAHDCRLGDHIIMGNAATLAGHVEIGDHAIVGAFCAIHQYCRIGAYSFLGSSSLVNQDVLPYSKTTAPRPLKVYGANRLGLERQGFSKQDLRELEAAFRLLTRSKLNTSQAVEAIESKGFESSHVRALVEFIRSSPRGVAK